MKSTDNLSFFESTSDYVHFFSCDKKDGEAWLEKILLARVSGPFQYVRECFSSWTHRQSYVIYQERAIISAPTGVVSGAMLSRAGTRKQRPVLPLLKLGVCSQHLSLPLP